MLLTIDCLESARYDYVVSPVVQEVRTLLQAPRVTGAFSMWHDQVQPIRAKLASFEAYGNNWDSYGAQPLDRHTLENASIALGSLVARSLIPYRVGASGDGSVIFECAVNNGKLLLEVCGDEVGIVWRKNGEANLCDTNIADLENMLTRVEDACL